MIAPSVDAASLATAGLAGPWPLSSTALSCLQPLVEEASAAADKRNLHVSSALARLVITDLAIRDRVQQLCGDGYQLWRTNFFQRHLGQVHSGVAWHHDKHFQDGDVLVDFSEVGDHISIVIGLDRIDRRSGPFHYIPASYQGELPGLKRDTRPFAQRPIEAHFLELPAQLEEHARQIVIPSGHFCLFHSALLHGSAVSSGLAARTSMVGRLVRQHCRVPFDCATAEEVIPFC